MKNNQYKKIIRPHYLFCALVVLFFTVRCKNIGDDIIAKGPVITKDVAISDYTKISLDVPFSLYYKQDTVAYLQLQGQQEIIDLIDATISDDELKLKFTKKINTANIKPVRIITTSKNLAQIINNQVGVFFINDSLYSPTLTLTNNNLGRILINKLDCNHLNVTSNNTNEINIFNGNIDSSFVFINGAGKAILINPISNYSVAYLNGNGNIQLNVRDTLTATIIGDGTIQYKGTDKVYKSITGKGKITKL